MSDSLEGMPEFDKPENIPLIVPDEPQPVTPVYCKATKKDGKPCPMRVNAQRGYCPPHDPNITEEQRQEWRKKGGAAAAGIPHTRGPKTPEEMLHILARRVDVFLSKCDEESATADELFILCHISKAFSVLWDRTKEGKGEASDGKQPGWRLRGTA